MPPIVLIALLIGLPLVLLTWLRVKPLYMFASVMTGYLWVNFLGEPAELVVQSLLDLQYPGVIARLVLLLLPVALTLFLMRKSLPAGALPFQFFLLVADSVLLAVLIIGLLPSGVQQGLYETNAGNIVRQANDVLIAGIAGLHVLVMWIMRPKHGDKHGHHKKKH